MATSNYEIPTFGTPAPSLLGWLLDAVSEGDAWLKSQQPARNWDAILQLLSADDGEGESKDLSNVGYNKARRVGRELVAALSNFRHEGEYKVAWDQSLYDKAHVLTQLDRHWYRKARVNRQHRAALQFAVAQGTAYFYETWDPHFWGPYRGDIRLQVLGPGDVTFVQLPKDHDIQRAYAVIIREELPINLAKAIYGQTNAAFANALVPDRDAPGWVSRGLQKVQQFLSPALRVGGTRSGKHTEGSFPTVDIFHMYTLDRAINTGLTPVKMGTHGTNWSYSVPALGDPIPQRHLPRNPATGEFWTLPASAADCRLFPLRRYTIFSRTGIGYDGSSPWWHGQVPVAALRFGDWPWEALGSSLLGEVRTMQQGIVALMRLIEDAANARLDPPAVFDENLVSASWAKSFNPRLAGIRAAANLQLGDPIKFPVPPQQYDVPNWIMQWITSQEDRMDYMTGVRDLVAIAKAKQIPGADTLEKLLEMAGPIVQDLVRAVEDPLQQLGEWRKAYYFQFYTRGRVISLTGLDGNEDDVDYTSAVLQPWQPTEKQTARARRDPDYQRDVPFRPEQLITMSDAHESPDARAERSRLSIDEFHYHVSESALNEIHRMTTKLFYIQLMKSGFPISWWTFAQIAKIPNFGPPPEGTNTEMERWVAQKRMEIELAAELQQQTQAMGGGMGAPDGGGVPNPDGGSEGGPGRPPSFSAPPKIVSKDGGTRSTITTSR